MKRWMQDPSDRARRQAGLSWRALQDWPSARACGGRAGGGCDASCVSKVETTRTRFACLAFNPRRRPSSHRHGVTKSSPAVSDQLAQVERRTHRGEFSGSASRVVFASERQHRWTSEPLASRRCTAVPADQRKVQLFIGQASTSLTPLDTIIQKPVRPPPPPPFRGSLGPPRPAATSLRNRSHTNTGRA